MKSVKFVVVSQGCAICEFDDQKEAERYVNSENLRWLKYVEECIDNFEPYADNECFLYRVVDGDIENAVRII